MEENNYQNANVSEVQDFRENEPKSSYWTNISKNFKQFGNRIADEARQIFTRDKFEPIYSEYLFDPHVTLHRRSYGTLEPYDYATSSPTNSRRGSEMPLPQVISPTPTSSDDELDGHEVDECEDIAVGREPPPIIISASSLPSLHIENEMYQRENSMISHEPDLNLLTVESARSPHTNGRMSPGRRSSGFLSGSITPITLTSSMDLNDSLPSNQPFTWTRIIKIIFLVGIFVLLACVIITTSENYSAYQLVIVSEDAPFVMPLVLSETYLTYYPILTVIVKGSSIITDEKDKESSTDSIYVDIKVINCNGDVETVAPTWEIPIYSSNDPFEGVLDVNVKQGSATHGFTLKEIHFEHRSSYFISFRSTTSYSLPLEISGRFLSNVVKIGTILGGAVIIGLYVLIIFELVNRTLAAMLAATAAIASLAAINERPTTVEMVSWLDMETLILLFSMMVIVSMLCETGFFDYASYLMYKVTNGEIWPLITSLCFFTGFVSAFLDNVTTILLMTPVIIRICEAMELNPVPVLISVVIFSNIGGAITPVGDPPNVIISNNKDVINAGIDFSTFSVHMLLGIIPVLIVAYIQLRFMFRSIKSLKYSEPYVITELRREVDVWSRAADSLSTYSKDERQVRSLILSKVLHLRSKLKSKLKMGGQSLENFRANLIDLEASCKIRDWNLLIKCGIVLIVVILLFFLNSIPQLKLSVGWTALLGAVLLLILADRRELEGILCRVEWSTLIFFSALFIVMEGVSRLGLLEWIGNETESIIEDINEESRISVSIILILWVSGLASAFIDNIPFTTMMIKIVTRLSQRLALPLQPLIWALAFGTCLGGNGTLIGASANVVSAGLAEQHGYKFTFMEYFKIGFPMMIVSLLVSTLYLCISHSWLQWNY